MNIDQAINHPDQDEFQRKNFAKQVANVLLNIKSNEGVVIAINGSWGEGKTSLMGIIKHYINVENKDNVVSFDFNPWRYADEDQLLTTYFNSLASLILAEDPRPRRISKNFKGTLRFVRDWIKYNSKRVWEWIRRKQTDKLTSDWELVGSLLTNYIGTLGSFKNIPIGDIAKSIGEKLENKDPERLIKRLEDIFKSQNKRVIVFIDDVDRLDKEEMYALFRLVKLTGNFSFITYLMFFDTKMVASAISHRYGNEGLDDGYRFLEKIVQLSMTMPRVLESDLQIYIEKEIKIILNQYQISFSPSETIRYQGAVRQFFIPEIYTPRTVKKLANNLRLVFPLLIGEINPIDLILIESLKLFYPDYYQFIIDNADYFHSHSASSQVIMGEFEYIEEKLDIKLKSDQHLSKSRMSRINNLFIDLFPTFFTPEFYKNRKLDKTHEAIRELEEIGDRDKRIYSKKYFDRYFSYTVLKDDLSDVDVNSFISNCIKDEKVSADEKFDRYIKDAGSDHLLSKLEPLIFHLDWSDKVQLIPFLDSKHEVFNAQIDHRNLHSYSRLSFFIYKILSSNENTQEVFTFLVKEISKWESLNLAVEVFQLITEKQKSNDKIFKPLASSLIVKLKNSRLFETFIHEEPKIAPYLLELWTIVDSHEEQQYLNAYIENNPKNIPLFIRSFLRTMYNPSKPHQKTADLKEEDFKRMIQLFDRELFYTKLINQFGEEVNFKEPDYYVLDTESSNRIEQTDSIILQQFTFFYNKLQRRDDAMDELLKEE